MKFCLSLVALMLHFAMTAQNQVEIDSLLHGVQTAPSDSFRLECHYELVYKWAEYNFDSSIYHARQMQEIARKQDDALMKFKALNATGAAFDYQYLTDSAIRYYLNAQEIAASNGFKKESAIALFNIGVVHFFAGQLTEAIDMYLEAETVYREIGDLNNLAVVYNNLGIIYRRTKKFEFALEMYQKSLEIKRAKNDTQGVMNTLTNLSSIYRNLEDFEQARITSEEVIELAKQQNNRGAYLSELLNLAETYNELEEAGKSKALYLEAEALLDEESPYAFKVNIYYSLLNYYLVEGNLSSARRYHSLMAEIINEENIEVAMNFYQSSSDYYEKTGEYSKALTSQKKAFDLREIFFDNQVLEKTTELEQVYEKEKRDLEIDQLNAENEIANLSISKRSQERNGLIILSILVIGLAILFYVLFRQKESHWGNVKSCSRRYIIESRITFK